MSQQTDTPPSRNDATDAAPPALVRKADVGRQEHQARAMTLAKALRLTAAKVADDLLDMALSVVELRTERRVVDDVPALLVPQNLLILLEGPNRQRGAAVLDQSLVEGLIQKLTTGKVQPAPEGAEGRKLTDTDAAICAPFLDALIARAGQLPEAPKDQAVLRGFAFGARTPEPRLLLMALDAASYHVFGLTLDIEGGRRQGSLTLILPEAAAVPNPLDRVEISATGDAPVPPAPIAPRTLCDPVLALEVALPVALARTQLSLKTLSTLSEGDVLQLEEADFAKARLLTPDGKSLGRVTLGQIDSRRAVQLHTATPVAEALGAFDAGDSNETVSVPLAEAADVAAGMAPIESPEENAAGPDLPDLDDIPDLPDLSDLPDLDDLAPPLDLPDLGDLKAG